MGYVLHWLIQGHVKYINSGQKLPECDQVLEATRNYFSDLGTPRQWLDERCNRMTVSVLLISMQPSEMLRGYKRWKQERGEAGVLAQRKFVNALDDIPTAKSNGIRLIGVHLKDPLSTRMEDWN